MAEARNSTFSTRARVLDEPDEVGRVRRWPDLMRLLFEALMIVAVVALGEFGAHTTSGVETDVHDGVELAPPFLLGAITVLMNIATAVIPIGLAIERLLRRDGRRVADAVIAAFLTCGITILVNVWTTSGDVPEWLVAELTHRLAAGSTTPLHVYIATVVAFLTVIGFHGHRTLRTFTWVCVGIYATAALMSGDTALVGLVVSVLLGRAIAFGWRYARGVVNHRSTGDAVVAGLTQSGVDPSSCRWLGDHGEARRYEMLCADGRRLEITVLDRDRQGIGAIYRLYRRIRLRGPAQRHNLLSVHRAAEHEALMSYALAAAGINTPRLVAVRELSPDVALLAYERVHACVLKQIPKEKFTDALLERVFIVVRDLGRHQIAHRRLALDSILVDEHGQVWLTELRDGEVAADDLQHLLDITGTMAALALKAGPERTVRIAAQVLGEDRVVAALPLLQPVALTGTTRAAIGKSKGLIDHLREQILELRPNAPAGEPVRLERLKIRTVLAVTAGCFAVYLLMLEISSASSQSKRSLWQLIAAASPGWLLVAAGAAALTYVAAAMQLAGFIPERLPRLQNLMVQFSASFIALFAPAAVGGVTLNVRYLQKRGVAAGPAVSAVGASQVVAFVMHIALIAVFSFFAGSGHTHDEASTVVIAILLGIAFLAMTTLSVAPLRHFAKRRLAFFQGSLPRLLQVAQNPRKLALALCGTLGISLFNALCLWTCVHTLGDGKQVSYPTIALMYLTVQAASSISPTPAGIGAIELGLGGALAIAGVEKQSAVVAVLVYRLLTAYLPAALGYAALHHLRRKRVV